VKNHVREPTDLGMLTAVISLAVFGLCLTGTLIGAVLPLIFQRLGADPAVASTPFVATFADVTGIVVYFSVAKAVFGAVLG
jgi:magnesium transporter